jgi:hypothetical protein
MPEALEVLLALVAAGSLASIFGGVYRDHVREQRRRRLDEIRRTPSPFEGALEVVGGHRGPGGDR